MRESFYEHCIRTGNTALLGQWDTVKNAPLTPAGVVLHSHRKVWWKCPQGHEWPASVHSRVQGTGCPICAGKAVLAGENDLQTLFPEIAAQWDREKNADCTPDSVTISSNRRVWWRCGLGHSFRTSVAHRVRSRSECPYCTNKKVLPGFNDLAAVKPRLAMQWDPELNGRLPPCTLRRLRLHRLSRFSGLWSHDARRGNVELSCLGDLPLSAHRQRVQ